MKKIPVWLWVLLFMAMLIAIKFIFFPKKNDATAANKPTAGKNNRPAVVNYAIAEKEALSNSLYVAGQAGAMNEIEVKTEISGKVTAIYFTEGSFVNKGAPLLKINDADLQAQLQKNYAQQNLNMQQISRLQKLYAGNGVSKEELENKIGENEVLKAEESYIKAQLAKTVITAPFSGTIGFRQVSVGAYISPALPIANLIQSSPMYIEFSVPERYAATMHKGTIVQFKTDDNKDFNATIYAIEPKIDEATKSLKIRAQYSGSTPLLAGAFVKVLVNISNAEKTILIPSQAVIPILNGQKVFVAENGKAIEHKVKTGIRSEDKIQIIEGINPGDTIITTGIMTMKNEAMIELIPTKK